MYPQKVVNEYETLYRQYEEYKTFLRKEDVPSIKTGGIPRLQQMINSTEDEDEKERLRLQEAYFIREYTNFTKVVDLLVKSPISQDVIPLDPRLKRVEEFKTRQMLLESLPSKEYI